jgi:hypothetical protein
MSVYIFNDAYSATFFKIKISISMCMRNKLYKPC